MSKNVGSFDRVARIIIGLVAIAVALFVNHPYAVWGWIGIVPLATGLIGWCPAYMPFGIKTCKTRGA